MSNELTSWPSPLPHDPNLPTNVPSDWKTLKRLKFYDFEDQRKTAKIYLNSVIFFVTDINKTHWISRNAPRIVEFSVGRSLTAESSEKSACELNKFKISPWKLLKNFTFITCRIKNLNSVIVTIGDDELSDSVDGHTSQTVKLSVTISVRAKLFQISSVCVKNLYAMIRWISDN